MKTRFVIITFLVLAVVSVLHAQGIKVVSQLVITEFHQGWHDLALDTKSKLNVEAKPGSEDSCVFKGAYEFDPRTMQPMVWNPGAVHTIIGKVVLKSGGNKYIFESDYSAPLVFIIDRKLGYVFQSGRGVVTYPDGHKIRLDKK